MNVTRQYIGVTVSTECCLVVDVQTLFARAVVCGDTAADVAVTISEAVSYLLISGP